jgi:hypothetical protein
MLETNIVELARYELRNILWKNFALQAKAIDQKIKNSHRDN